MGVHSNADTAVHRSELAQVMVAEARDFIASSYRLVLGREPDPQGVAYYMNRLRAGCLREEVIAQLYFSPEAQARGRRNPALARMCAPYGWRKVPVLGWFVGIVLFLVRCVNAPRYARAAAWNVWLLGEEMHGRLHVIDQRLVAMEAATQRMCGIPVQANHPASAPRSPVVPPSGERLPGRRVTIEELLEISRLLQRSKELA